MKKYFLLLLMIVTVVMMEQAAVADIINFGDTAIYWPGYPAINDRYSPSDNTQDTIGQPKISDGWAQVNTGDLTSIGFIGNGYSTYSIVRPGDLFIDVGSNQTWDYVVSLQQYPNSGSYPVYAVSIPLSQTTAYLITGPDNSGFWLGYEIRNDHPYALKSLPSNIWGSASFSGFVNGGVPTFTFGQPIAVGDTFIVGWTMNCANEVIYENVHTTPAPEPTTILLLGFGLIGVGALGKKLKR